MVALTGHKGLLGPQGTGALWVRDGVDVDPMLRGGTGGDSLLREMPASYPDHLEAGTPNAPGIAGLLAGIEWVRARGVDALHEHGATLKARLRSGFESIPGVRVLSPHSDQGAAIVTIVANDIDVPTLAARLDKEHGVLTRPGLHCAPEAHRVLGGRPPKATSITQSTQSPRLPAHAKCLQLRRSTQRSIPDPTHSVRLFVAINLPDNDKLRLGEAIGTLAVHDLPVRWVEPESLHITLKFLGEVAEPNVPAVRTALQQAVAGHRSFDVALEGLGAFPSLSRPNIFWVGASNPAALAQLQQSVELQMEAVGFPREARPFRAHITVGRVKARASIRDRALMDRMVSQFRYKTQFQVTSAELMRSHVSSRGARYEVVAKMDLN
jgi:2'-5' RNA ligase